MNLYLCFFNLSLSLPPASLCTHRCCLPSVVRSLLPFADFIINHTNPSPHIFPKEYCIPINGASIYFCSYHLLYSASSLLCCIICFAPILCVLFIFYIFVKASLDVLNFFICFLPELQTNLFFRAMIVLSRTYSCFLFLLPSTLPLICHGA